MAIRLLALAVVLSNFPAYLVYSSKFLTITRKAMYNKKAPNQVGAN